METNNTFNVWIVAEEEYRNICLYSKCFKINNFFDINFIRINVKLCVY